MDYLSLEQAEKVVFFGEKLEIDKKALAEVERSYRFLEQFHKDKVIYGINTGFGPMAQWRVDDRYLKDLQYNTFYPPPWQRWRQRRPGSAGAYGLGPDWRR